MRHRLRWLSWIGLLTLLPWTALAAAPQAAAQSCVQYVTDGGFETDTAWHLGHSPIMPRYVTYTRHSGYRALALGITSGANVESYSSARQTVTLPAAAPQIVLSFWFYALADSPATTDYMEAVLLNPAGDVILNKLWQSHNDSRLWNQMTLDLSAWRGQTVQLYFNVYNDGVGGTAALFLDDVSLSACDPAPTVTPTGPAPTVTLTTAPAASPTPTVPAGGCVTALSNGGFESGLDAWQAQGDPNGAIPVTSSSHTGAWALRLGALDQPLNGVSSVRQQVTIPAGYAQTQLAFWVYPFAEAGAGADYQRADLLNSAGTVLTTLWNEASDARTWLYKQIDIAPYAGQTVFVRFSVNNDGGGGRTALYLDDVVIRACAASVTVTPPATAVPTAATPSATTPATGCQQMAQNGSFESGLNAWQAGASQLPAHTTNALAHDGSYSLQLGSQTANAETYSSVRQPVSVPTSRPRLVVSFWAYTWSEETAGTRDRQQFVVLGPAGDVLAVPWSVLESSQHWQQQTFDIIGMGGQTVALYFNAINDGGGGRTALFIDDVTAWACPTGVYPPGIIPATAPPPAATLPAATAAPTAATAPTAGATPNGAAPTAGTTLTGRPSAPQNTPGSGATRVGVPQATLSFAGTPVYSASNRAAPETTGLWAFLERLRPKNAWGWGAVAAVVALLVFLGWRMLNPGKKTTPKTS